MPYKDPEKQKLYHQKYYARNKEKQKLYHQKYYARNKEILLNRAKAWNKTHGSRKRDNYRRLIKQKPWLGTYYHIRARCLQPKNKDYRYYGGKGIKVLITVDELKALWFRDKATKMKRPSIDRKNPDGHYEISNCRYIELRQNTINRNRFKRK